MEDFTMSDKVLKLIEDVKALTVMEPVSYTHLDVYKRQDRG